MTKRRIYKNLKFPPETLFIDHFLFEWVDKMNKMYQFTTNINDSDTYHDVTSYIQIK